MKKNTFITFVNFLVIIFFVFIGIYQLNPPNAAPINVPLTEFSSGRAIKHLEIIAQKPHPMGSSQNSKVGNYIFKELTNLGLSPEVQETTAINKDGPPFVAGTVRNILAKIEATNNTKAVLLVAHYDSVPNGPGASDDGAALAALLETARSLKASSSLKNDVIFLFTDGEEVGLLGAEAFVAEHPWAKDVGIVLNFEARGNSGPVIMFETSDQNGWFIQEFAKAAHHLVANSLTQSIYKLLPNDTDFTIFKEAGLAGFNFAYLNGVVYYHTAYDNLKNIDERSLQHHGEYALALTRHFGNLRLNQAQKGDAVYFDIFGSFLVHYSQIWVFPLSVFVVLLFSGIVIFGFRQKLLTFNGIALGFLCFLLSAIAASASILIIWWFVRILHNQYTWLIQGDTYNSHLYIIAFIALAIAITSAIYIYFSKKVSLYNLQVGALLWWLIFMVLTSLYLPGASYLLTWPLLFSLIGLGLALTTKSQKSVVLHRLPLLTVFAIPGIILSVPVIYLAFHALTVDSSGVIIIWVVLLLSLLIPNFYIISHSSKRLLTTATLLICLSFLIAGSFTANFDTHHPKPNNIFYTYNADTNKAIWASTDPKTDEWTSQFLSTHAQQSSLPDFLPLVKKKFITNPAPVVALTAPNIKKLGEKVSNHIRTLYLQITSSQQARVMRIYVDLNAQIVQFTLNNKQITNKITDITPDKLWGLNYFAVPKEGIKLTLMVKSSQPIKLKVVEQSDGLPKLLNQSLQTRPSYMMPTAFGYGVSDSTLVSKSFTF